MWSCSSIDLPFGAQQGKSPSTAAHCQHRNTHTSGSPSLEQSRVAISWQASSASVTDRLFVCRSSTRLVACSCLCYVSRRSSRVTQASKKRTAAVALADGDGTTAEGEGDSESSSSSSSTRPKQSRAAKRGAGAAAPTGAALFAPLHYDSGIHLSRHHDVRPIDELPPSGALWHAHEVPTDHWLPRFSSLPPPDSSAALSFTVGYPPPPPTELLSTQPPAITTPSDFHPAFTIIVVSSVDGAYIPYFPQHPALRANASPKVAVGGCRLSAPDASTSVSSSSTSFNAGQQPAPHLLYIYAPPERKTLKLKPARLPLPAIHVFDVASRAFVCDLPIEPAEGETPVIRVRDVHEMDLSCTADGRYLGLVRLNEPDADGASDELQLTMWDASKQPHELVGTTVI